MLKRKPKSLKCNSTLRHKKVEIFHLDLSKLDKAKLLSLEGLLLDVLPEYQKGAEEVLAKSMRLNPSDPETMNILGHILWKKGDLEGSKNCFEESVKKKPNLRGLRYLAITLRSVPCDPKEKAANIQRSVDLAKQALSLNLKDGESWCMV